jgi:Ion channel
MLIPVIAERINACNSRKASKPEPGMIASLIVGTIAISITVLIHTFGLIAVTRIMGHLTNRFRMHGHRSRVVAMLSVVFGLFVVLTIEIWFWALVYLTVGAFEDFEHALYYSTVAFSTVGFGDVVPDFEWRLLGALEAINGFLMIGWSTAYLIAASTRVGPFRSGEHF